MKSVNVAITFVYESSQDINEDAGASSSFPYMDLFLMPQWWAPIDNLDISRRQVIWMNKLISSS